MSWHGLRVAMIGPLPPPAGGMANQVLQLADLMRSEGALVDIVRTNPAYRPAWIASVRGARALARLLPYLVALWRSAATASIFHIMANSGWSWHLSAVPAIWTARLRGVPYVVNYHGGEAEAFLSRASRWVRVSLGPGGVLVVPSEFLHRVFGAYGIAACIVPNVVDLTLFRPKARLRNQAAKIVVARNLEPIYDIPTALRAFARIRAQVADAKLLVAGSGPERARLEAVANELRIADATSFTGSLDREGMAVLYQSANLILNPSRADNLPVSIIEALACGIPVVSTRVGGIPFMVQDGVSALLVEPGDDAAMAEAALRLLRDPEFADGVARAGLGEVQRYGWARVGEQWLAAYSKAIERDLVSARTA